MTATKRPLILVLEDEAVIAMELEARLRGLGYRVAGPAANADQAMALARAEHPDLLLADIRLSGHLDGVAVADALRKELGIPAVYLSAYADAATLSRAVASDPFGYLTKPLRESELHATITTALHRDRLEKSLAQRERELAASEARFRAVFDASPDALLVVDENGIVQLANEPAAALFGFATRELTGLPVRQLIRPEIEGVGSPSLAQGLTRCGVEIPLEIKVNRSAPESALGTVLAARDISERVRKDLELQKLATVVEHARECISLCTLDGRLIFLNEAGRRMLGIAPAELGNHSMDEVTTGPLQGLVRNEVLPKLRSGHSWEGELQLVNLQTGALTEVHCTSCPVTSGPAGAPSYLAWVALDITERKRTEHALAQSREELLRGQKLESLGRLAGGVAHDFGNMLTVILGLSRLLVTLLSEQPHALSLIRDIHEAGTRSHDLVQRLLAFSRRQPLQARTLELNAQVRDFSRLIGRTLGSSVELVLELDEGSFVIWMEPAQLEQALLNLVLNARDAMSRGGRLWVRTRREPSPSDANKKGYVLEVEDEGHGMSEEVRRRLFEPFFTTKEPGMGTGLGLSVVYGVVTQAHGEVAVRSIANRGTTFTVWLPAYKTQESTETHQAGTSDASHEN